MRATPRQRWLNLNHRHIEAAIGDLRRLLDSSATPGPASPARSRYAPYRLDLLQQRFDLSDFERALVVMTAGVELDGEFGRLVASRDPDGRGPSFAVALATLPGAHWSALRPEGPLRRWRLLTLRDDGSLIGALLVLDEYLLHWLIGAADESAPLTQSARPLDNTHEPPTQHLALAGDIAERLKAGGNPPVVEIIGSERTSCLAVAQHAAMLAGLRPWRLAADAIPSDQITCGERARLWERDLVLGSVVPVIEVEADYRSRAALFAQAFDGPLFLCSAAVTADLARPSVRHHLDPLDFAQRRDLWVQALGSRSDDGAVDRLAYQFALDPAELTTASVEAKLGGGRSGLVDRAWAQARIRARRDVGEFARRVISRTVWDDLVLPPAQLAGLHAIEDQVRHQATVYAAWGFGARSSRGLGITALFSGPSGTGKTTAAEAMAASLELDLLHVDLSQVVSKYIGETEKNLDQLFAAAESGGSILLFDEADAIFGKRSEVRDSHDRYANMEVSYLLQRMEAYRGLAILTTNQKDVIDQAFLRRIRFVIHFPFPDRSLRETLWRRAFPEGVLDGSLDWAVLARLLLSGGSIRNVALNAAFHAAAAGERVGMAHVRRALAAEGAKLEAPQLIIQFARSGDARA
jgi:hypothetical protein